MQLVSILIFFTTFIFIVLVALYICVTFYNKRARAATDRFTLQAKELKPTILENIKLRYWTTSGHMTRISSSNRCDLHLFDNCLAIVRRQRFIYKILFAPVLLTFDVASTKNMFTYLDTYKPDRITFKEKIGGDVDIKWIDPIYSHYITEITFQGLTIEQTAQLERIKCWF